MPFKEYTDTLAKLIKGLKKDLGATKIRQGYRGTGARAHRRQLFVDFPNGEMIDLWVDDSFLGLGGVLHTNYGKIHYAVEEGERILLEDGRLVRTPQAVYDMLVVLLRPLAAAGSVVDD